MNSNNITDGLVDFSKYLLVTVFAIFAFTSGPLLATNCLYVKLAYIASLLLAILSLYFAFKAELIKINHLLNIDSKKRNSTENFEFPDGKLEDIRNTIQSQFWASTGALTFLTVAIIMYFFSENYFSVIVK